MDNVRSSVLERVQILSDLELATLSCLIAEQHCIIESDEGLLESLEQEIRFIARDIFGLPLAALNFSANTSLDDLSSAILIDDDSSDYKETSQEIKPDPELSLRTDLRREGRGNTVLSSLDSQRIANIIVARNLHLGQPQLQTQVLELIRGKRIFTRSAVHVAPKRFLIVALIPRYSRAPLDLHLNDHFFISHFHSAEDELTNLDASLGTQPNIENGSNQAQKLRKSSLETFSSAGLTTQPTLFSKIEIDQLVTLSTSVRMTAEIRAYLHNITIFMRMNRAVAGGVSSLATRHFHLLVRTLAPLHGLDYIPPSLVALAARKIYPHRLTLATPENERSMQWGSSLDAVREELEGITVEDVIEDVLNSVEVPL